MAYNLDNRLVIGVSSRALFDLTKENTIFENEGVDAYCKYQIEHETDILAPGPGFSLIEALLKLNTLPNHAGRVEVIVMSRNSADTSLRVFNSIKHYKLDITRAVLASGATLAPYLNAFRTFCRLMRMMCREPLIPVLRPVLFVRMVHIRMK
jgi:5'-nucleotidase